MIRVTPSPDSAASGSPPRNGSEPHLGFGTGPALLGSVDLPLERMYQAERERANELLFTQPWQGSIQQWTWAQAVAETRRIARYLVDQRFPVGSRIAIVGKNSAWWIMADFAIWMAGHVSVPIFPTAQDASVYAIFEQTCPVACFLGAVDHLPSLDQPCFEGIRWITFPHQHHEGAAQWDCIIASQPPLTGAPARSALELASIIYTSGTTGQPKGVMHTFQSLSLMAISVKKSIGNEETVTDRLLSHLPLAHIAERAIVELSMLFSRIHVYFTEGQPTFLADLRRARPTGFFTIPRLLIRFQQSVFEKLPAKRLDMLLKIPIVKKLVSAHVLKSLGLATVRLAASGAAPIPASVIEWYQRLGLNLVEGYGMTETGVTHNPEPGKARVGYVGDASIYAETRISSEGEIQIRGPMNFAGYYLNPEATRACFTSDGFFRTGDRGELDAQNRLRIIGRLKEEFKTSKGKYIVPSQIENALSLSRLFESVCVLGSGMTAPFVMAVLVPETRQTCEDPAGREAIEQRLLEELAAVNAQHEHHEQVKFFVIDREPWTTANGLLTPTLKVRRSALESRFGSLFGSWENEKKSVLWTATR